MKKGTALICAALILTVVFAFGCNAQAPHQNEEYTPPDLGVDETISFELFVGSFNLYGSMMNVERIGKVSAYIEKNDFDIIGFQEVDKNARRSGRRDYLSMLVSEKYSASFFAPTYALGENYGLGVLAEKPLHDEHVYRLPYPYRVVKSDVEERIMIRSVVATKQGVPVVFYNVHLSFEEVSGGAQAHRAKQIEFILSVLKSDPNPYKVIAGDFNIASLSELTPFEEAGYKIAFTEGKSHEEGLLDNIVFSESLSLSQAQMMDLETSDHLLLQAKLIKE